MAPRSKNSIRAASRRVFSGSKFRDLDGPPQHGQQIEKGGQTDRQTGRETEGQADRQAGREAGRGRGAGRQRQTDRDRQAG